MEAGTAFALTATTSWVAGTVDEEEEEEVLVVVRYSLPAAVPAGNEGKFTALKKLHIQQLEFLTYFTICWSVAAREHFIWGGGRNRGKIHN